MRKPKGRTLEEFVPLMPGEAQLLQACANGDEATLGNQRPTQKTGDNAVRADFIRFLALGGDDNAPVHERGVRLAGGWIEGALNLTGAVIHTTLSLRQSYFPSTPVLEGAEIAGRLNLSGSEVPGLRADQLRCKRSVFLSKRFTAVGEIRMVGARIGGNLDCRGAQLDGQGSDCLSMDGTLIRGDASLSHGFTAVGKVCLLGAQIGGDLYCQSAKLDGQGSNCLSVDRAVIHGSVFLTEGFTAVGEVRLLGAQIGGDFYCQSAKLDGQGSDCLSMDSAAIKGGVFLSDGFTAVGEVRLLGAQIGGNLNCQSAKLDGDDGGSLSADGMTVSGAFFFRHLKQSVKHVQLSSAKVGQLIDDADSWGDQLVLDGFVYSHIAGQAPTDAMTRLKWLKKQQAKHTGADGFRPQPWKQLQTVLRNMGHEEDARQIAIALEDHMRSVGLIGQTPSRWPGWRRGAYRTTAQALHWLFKALIGYGYRPLRLAGWMVCVWLACAFIYWCAALQGVMAPSNPLVFQNKAYEQSCKPRGPAPEAVDHTNWYLCKDLPEEYTGFSPLAYSLDLLLPLVDLQQEPDWAPMIPTPAGTWYQELLGNWSFKHFVRLTVWFQILFGWVASLLLVAVVSGLTKRREE